MAGTNCPIATDGQKKQVADILNTGNVKNFTQHSGGAKGSDSVWDDVGKAYGISSPKHYYHGAKTPRGNVEISQADFEEGKEHVFEANATLHRRPERYLDLLSRNWKQVKESDGIFAIGNLNLRTGIVDGGTGWAVQMAIDYNKTADKKKLIYVFNQKDGNWYTNVDGTWRKSATPVLTENFAGIGTQEITEDGFKAIQEVFKNTFPSIEPEEIRTSQTFNTNEVKNASSIKFYSGKITPEKNVIFVFGSNPEGRHGAGAAKVAIEQFGAIYGQGEGLQGNSYALPTKDLRVKENNSLKSIPEEEIISNIKKLYETARKNPNKTFKIAYTNSADEKTLNGYTGREMSQMFLKAGPIPSNIEFSENWKSLLQKKEHKVERDRTSERDKAEVARFNEWWENIGKARFHLEEGEDIFDEETLKNHPKRDQLLEEYRLWKSGKTVTIDPSNPDFRMRKRAEMRNLIYAFPNYGLRRSAIEALGETIDDVIQYIRKHEDSEFADVSESKLADVLNAIKPQVRTWLLESIEGLEKEMEKLSDKEKETAQRILNNLTNLVNNIDGLWGSAVEYYKMYFENITDAARKNEGGAEIGTEDDPNAENDINNENKEYSGKDAYEDKFGKRSIESTANHLTKEVFFQVVELDKNGKPIRNAFNRPQRVDPRRIFAALSGILVGKIRSQEEMVKKIEDFSKTPRGYWAKTIVDMMKYGKEAEDIKNAIFVCFNKSHINYTAQVVLNGITKMKVFDQSDAANELFKRWRYEAQRFEKLEDTADSEKLQTIFTEDKLFVDGKVVRRAVVNLRDPLIYFSTLIDNEDVSIEELTANGAAMLALSECFKAIGIYLDEEDMQKIFDYVPTEEDYPIPEVGRKSDIQYKKSLLEDIAVKLSNIYRLVENYTEDAITEHIIRGDLKQLANTISKVLPEIRETSQKFGKNIRYNTVNNSFVLTQEKSILGTKEEFDAWADKHWKEDPWYNNSNDTKVFKPYSHLLKLLQESQQERDATKRVTFIVDKDGEDYERMSSADIVQAEMVCFLQEYEGGNKQRYAYYRDGLFGDSPKFQFVRMRVYDKETVARHLSNFILQEYNRINRVNELFERRKAGEPIRINGNLIKNGRKFNFFPELNNTTVSKYELLSFLGVKDLETSSTRISFKEALDILQEKNPLKMSEFIQNHLYRIEGGQESGLLVEKVKEDRRFLEREGIAGPYGRDEFRTKSGASIERYNKKHNNELAITVKGVPGVLVTSKDLLTEEELRAYKTKITSIINKLDTSKAEDISKKSVLEFILSQIEADLKINPTYNIESFLYNRMLASIELFELRDKDLAYYKNYEDYIKRSKQAAGDYTSPNTEAPTQEKNSDGTKKSKSTEKILIVKDFMVETSKKSLAAIDKILESAKKDKKITDSKAAFVKKKWEEKIKATDGQMYRTIMSKRDLDIMLAFEGSTDEVLAVYNKMLSDGNPTDEELENANRVISSMKEYGYGMPASNMFAPTQLKNGTQILQTSKKNGGIYHYMPVLRALQEFAEEFGFDAIAFESGIKVGLGIEKEGVLDDWDCDSINLSSINPESPTAYQDAKGLILEEYGKKSQFCTIDFDLEFHGEQTKEGNFEEKDPYMAVGTQTSKIIPSVLLASDEVSIGKLKMSGRQAFNLYQAVASLRMIGEWNKVKEVFRNNETLHAKLIASILASNKFNAELFEGMQTDENGKPLIPYNDITIRNIFEDKLLAYGRRSLSKVLTPNMGSHFFTASDAGLDAEHKLEAKYNPDGTLKYVPCYLPAYYKQWVEDCLSLNEENCFTIDLKKLEEKYRNKEIPANVYTKMYDLFECIGYRVPSEGMCSIMPLRVAGFMPMTNNSTIILPSEMITKTGEDMDGDEIFFIKHAERKYKKEDFIKDNHLEDLSEEEQNAEWEKKKDFYENTIVKAGYRISDSLLAALEGEKPMTEDVYKELSNMSQRQLHNLLLDLMLAATRTKEGTLEGIQFSSFEDIEKTAAIMNMINKSSLDKSSLEAEALWALNKTSEEIKEKTEGEEKSSPMTLGSSMKSSEEALAGKKFLSIFAVGKAVGAITSATATKIIDGPTIGGKKLSSLSTYYHENQETPSTNNAELVAACPDNSKNPTIAAFGVSQTTVNVIQLLAQAGFPLTTIGFLMNQPIVKQMAREVDLIGVNPSPRILLSTIEEYLYKYDQNEDINKFLNKEVTAKILSGEILNTSDKALLSNIVSAKTSKSGKLTKEEYKTQVYIGALFLELFKIADQYNKRGRCLRGDSNSGSAASTLEETLERIQTVKDYVESTKEESFFEEDFPITDPNYTPEDDESDESVFKHIMNSSFPLVNAQYILGLKGLTGQLSKIFPETNPKWTDAIFSQRNFSKRNFKINDLYTFLWQRHLQENPGEPRSKALVEIVLGMPQRIQNLKDDSKYTNNNFVKNLGFEIRKIGNSEKSMTIIMARANANDGAVSTTQMPAIIDGWKQLNEDSNPAVRQIARDMLLYFLYVYGNTFKKGSLATFRPNSVVLDIVGYLEGLEELSKAPDETMVENYKKQSLYNHLYEYAFKITKNQMEELGLEESDTYDKVIEKMNTAQGKSIAKSVKVLKLETSDDKKVFLMDVSVEPSVSQYKVVKPKNVYLGGLSIVNMDSGVDADNLEDIEEILIERAQESYPIAKNSKSKYKKNASKSTESEEENKEAPDEVDTDEEVSNSTADSEREDADDETRGATLAEMRRLFGSSFNVEGVEENKNSDGRIVDKEGNVKC